MKYRIVLIGLIFLTMPSLTNAGTLSKLLGFDEIGLKAAEKAEEAVKIAKEASEKASRNVAVSVNQFGILLEEYHAGNDEEKKRARKIINSIFPDIPKDTERISFEVT